MCAWRPPCVPPPHGVGVAPYESEGAVKVADTIIRRPRTRIHLHIPSPEEGARQAAIPAEEKKGRMWRKIHVI